MNFHLGHCLRVQNNNVLHSLLPWSRRGNVVSVHVNLFNDLEANLVKVQRVRIWNTAPHFSCLRATKTWIDSDLVRPSRQQHIVLVPTLGIRREH